jgi:iron-sulfur cluster assembly protein
LKAVVTLTPAALARIREVQQRDGRAYMRVSVVNGGPTGYMYDMRMDDKFDPKADYLNETDSVKVVVDMRSSLFLNGATIDWQTTSDGRQGFKFDNPNSVSAAPSDARR